MTSRHTRPAPKRAPAPLHRGPQAVSPTTQAVPSAFHHAPNAALLIDFDNVTMGIRSDLGNELRNLLGSDIIKGKVAVQRAYADWRRYPQYIVPLAESSIDMIMAPAYGSSKKNATDIRLAVDAMELVFTRPEIGTYILLSGDSDFASLVTKLKEYGKYVIGVGIRESSSDLLVMNCDEYYSYNALAGLVRSAEEESVKRDPWELVSEAIQKMKRNGDVMRSDRLKQVMQELDSSFDEKNLGISKFSKFCLEAAQRGLLSVSRLENGQFEVDVPATGGDRERRPSERRPAESRPAAAERGDEESSRGRRGRRGGRGRGRTREEAAAPPAELVAADAARSNGVAAKSEPRDEIGASGERLSREEAFDLVSRAVDAITKSADDHMLASEVRASAYMILGRDSESLSERNFQRILQDAHNAGVIDLRRRGNDFEVARAADAPSVADQLATAAKATAPAPSSGAAPARRRGVGTIGKVTRGRPAPPPDLLSVGVVDLDTIPAIGGTEEPSPAAETEEAEAPAKPKPHRSRKRTSGARAAAGDGAEGDSVEKPAGKPRRPRARKPAARESTE